MFNSISDAKTVFLNSGMIDFIDIERFDEIVESLYRNATNEESANEIITSFSI